MRRIVTLALAPMVLALATGVRAQAPQGAPPQMQTPPQSQTTPPPESLAEARTALMGRGFEPARLRHPGTEPDSLCQRTDICSLHPEVFFCSGSSAGICDFAYVRQSDHKWMVVETTGGTAFTVRSIRPANELDWELIREYL